MSVIPTKVGIHNFQAITDSRLRGNDTNSFQSTKRLPQLTMRDFAVIFDMDGVIVDSNPAHKQAIQQFCSQHGYSLSETELQAVVYGRTTKDALLHLMGELPSELLELYSQEKEAIFRELFAPQVQVVEGLIPFLQLLQNHQIVTAIATSAPTENVEMILEKTAISHFFTAILDQRFVEKSKPDPDIYLKTAKKIHFPPARCIVFEDSLSGIAAAQRAGMKVIGITTTHTPAELQATDKVITDFVNLTVQELQTLFF